MSNNTVILATKKYSRNFIIFSNHTSQNDCLDYENIDFVFATENEITLYVPIKSCAQGHNLSLYIFENDKTLRNLKSMPKEKSVLNCWVINGYINFFEKVTDTSAEISLILNETLNESFNKFIQSIDSKQEFVSNIFDRYRT